MFTDTMLTLYRFNGKGFDRLIIPHCHWQECKAANVLKSGMQSADGIVIYIPSNALVLAPNNLLFPSNRLFLNADISPLSPSQDIIVKGECNFIFDNSSDRSVSESLKALRDKYEIHTVMSIDRLLYGPADLQHIKVSAR